MFHRRPPQLPAHDLAADMQVMVEEVLASRGYRHYETSAFAQPGLRSRHNLNYWEFGDYLGIGAGAHGKISFPDRVTRHVRIKQPREYMEAALKGASLVEDRVVEPRELPFEFMLNALRLIDGFAIETFSLRTGLPFAAILPALEGAELQGLLGRDLKRVWPTPKGQRFLNELLELFLPVNP